MNEIDISKLGEIEHILLPPNCHFDEERQKFISCESSRDLVACAGSGKTTCLVAKLLLLEKVFPFSDNKGICVLTHTNVAIDEITRHLGNSSSMLSHPNVFMGTIQQFVNKFLTIPYYKNQFAGSPFIDDSFYNAEWKKRFIYISRDAKAFCHRNERHFFPSSLRVNYHTGDLSTSISGKKISASDQIIQSIRSVRKQITDAGYLSFDDAYNYAFEYLSKYPYIATVIREKFKYVFIDEMQDTAIHQSEILDTIFDPNKITIQKIGDNNQAIYDDDESSEFIWTPRNRLSLSKSLRFSCKIADAIAGVRLDKTDVLLGNENVVSIPPQMILFSEPTSANVIPKFIELVNQNKELLLLTQKDKVKIIGWKGKPNTIDNIQKYFPSFSKMSSNRFYSFSNCYCYLEYIKRVNIKKKTLKFYRDLIMQIALRFLYVQNIKIDGVDLNLTKMIKILKTNHDILEKILGLSVSLSYSLEVREMLRNLLSCDIFPALGIQQEINEPGSVFLNSEDLSELEYISTSQDKNDNICGYIDGIPIEVANVHKVKGETHKATLYIETKYYEHDLEKIIPYLIDSQTKVTSSPRDKYRTKVVYVGISRASALLCLALRQTAVSEVHRQTLQAKGWEIYLI